MPQIKLTTLIKAPIDRCFDLTRSIDLHKISTEQTKEEAIAGVTSGLINLNESVTWRAKHFNTWQKLTVKITAFRRPVYFTDEMQSGAFKGFKHEHKFASHKSGTIMTDVFGYTSPLGWLGRVADRLFLKKYMEQLLTKRNMVIKEFAESEMWRRVLP